jgi:hypothetical protein
VRWRCDGRGRPWLGTDRPRRSHRGLGRSDGSAAGDRDQRWRHARYQRGDLGGELCDLLGQCAAPHGRPRAGRATVPANGLRCAAVSSRVLSRSSDRAFGSQDGSSSSRYQRSQNCPSSFGDKGHDDLRATARRGRGHGPWEGRVPVARRVRRQAHRWDRTCRTCVPSSGRGPSVSVAPAPSIDRRRPGPVPIAATDAGSLRSPRADRRIDVALRGDYELYLLAPPPVTPCSPSGGDLGLRDNERLNWAQDAEAQYAR